MRGFRWDVPRWVRGIYNGQEHVRLCDMSCHDRKMSED